MSSEDKLDHSLRLLDDALSVPPSSVFRWSKGRSLRSSTSNQHGNFMASPGLSRDNNIKVRKSDVRDMSITIFPDEEMSLLGASVTLTETIPYSMPQILNTLFKEFQSIYQTSGNTQHVFEAVSSFIELITNTISSLWSGKELTDKMGNNIRWLLEELNTWKLVYALYKDRTTLRNHDEPMESSHYMHHPSSEKEIVADLYYTESSVREAQLVVDWLETCYRHEYKLKSHPSVVHYTDKTIAWENTLCQLNCGSTNLGLNQELTSALVSDLDPDCIYRQHGRSLHYLDGTNDGRLLEQIFEEIRCGQLEQAQKLCIHCGQEWRAAALEGWRLFHDPNYDSNTYHGTTNGLQAHTKGDIHREILPIEGNPHRDLWKICAWDMCENPLASNTERAIMGSLCGHLTSVLNVCKTWEDQLWAYTKVSIDVTVEKYIREVSLRNYQPLAESYWNNQWTMEKIMMEVGKNDGQFNPNRKLQELVILDKSEELITLCSNWLENANEGSNPQFLRYICHLILILRAVGRPASAYIADKVISAYVKVLMELGDCDSVAYYSSLLPVEEQVYLYSMFMEGITDNSGRADCLSAAEKYDLQIPLITEKVVQNVRNRKKDSEIESGFSLVREVSDADKEKISALDWMVYYSHQRAECIWECNTLVRTFIAQGKVTAARLAFDKVPSGSIELVLQQYCSVNSDGCVNRGSLPPKIDATIKEHLCYKAYLDAQEGFSRWFHEFHNTRPTVPTKYEGNDFTEKVAYEHRLNRYNEEYNRWKSNMQHETKMVKTLLFNIITFPDDGWLVDDFKEDVSRKENMQRLRGLIIPQVFLLLHKVLHSMELYEEVADLVTLLMEESTHYYEIFNKSQLSDFTVKISESCDSMLNTFLDPFGWEAGDPIDVVDDFDGDDNAVDRNLTSMTHLNVDTTLEEVPGVGDNETVLEEEELLSAWTKMAESNISKAYGFQTLKETNYNLEESDEDSL